MAGLSIVAAILAISLIVLWTIAFQLEAHRKDN